MQLQYINVFFSTFLYVNMNKAQINIIMLNVEILRNKLHANIDIVISHASTQRRPMLYG